MGLAWYNNQDRKTKHSAQQRARAAHKNLEKEAIRVIKLLPIFKPGIYDGKKVIVPYSLPIIFEIN